MYIFSTKAMCRGTLEMPAVDSNKKSKVANIKVANYHDRSASAVRRAGVWVTSEIARQTAREKIGDSHKSFSEEDVHLFFVGQRIKIWQDKYQVRAMHILWLKL